MMSNNLFGKKLSVKKPPSLSYKTLTNFLESFQRKDIPSHIDKNVLPASMSGGNQAYLINALKFLELISENNSPQEKFYRLVRTEQSIRISTLREILRSSYGFLLNEIDISTASTQSVADKFKEQGVMDGNNIRKAIVFFLSAAQDAGMEVSPQINPSEVAKLVKALNKENKEPTHKTVKELTHQLIDLLDEDMGENEENAVWTLIRYLKKKIKADQEKQNSDSQEVEQ
jgi:hypothetical protein